MDAERECRGWVLLLLKSNPELDKTAAIQENKERKKRESERGRVRVMKNSCSRADELGQPK
jgi:hypothetical protein